MNNRIKHRQEQKQRRRLRRVNRGSMFLVSGVLLLLTAAMAINGINLKSKVKAHEATRQELQTMIDQEKDRSQEIKEMKAYVGSDEYLEQVARDKLGLAYDNEIVFKAK